MLQFLKIAFICVIIIWLSVAFAENTTKRISAETTSNSSLTESSSNFSEVNKNKIFTEYVREHNVTERWKSMETSVVKMLTAMYNESLPTLSQLTKDLDISFNCKRDLTKMLTGIKEFKYWAIQMIDSFGKIPIGFERGTFSALGDFDQCLDVDVPGHFQGQYCNLDFIMPLPKRQRFVTLHTEIPEVMKALNSDGYFAFFGKFGRLLYFINPRVSICVPSTCPNDELQKIANKAVQAMDLPFGLRIPNCEVLNKKIKFDNIEITLMIILGILLLLATIATVVDVYLKSMSEEEENSNNCTNLLMEYLQCFSLFSNAKGLFKPENDPMKIFHGMRFLVTLWEMLVHSCIFLNYSASGALVSSYWYTQQIAGQLIINAFITVETFFFMSATLHACTILKRKGKINIKKHILQRVWRLAPTFMLVIACVILLPHVGSGPVWKETVGDILADKCRAGWWTNLLFINNFLPSKDMCLLWLWYIPADFHLYVLSLIVLIPMKNNPSLGLLINFLLMIGAMIISATFHVYHNLTPIPVFSFLHPEDIYYFTERGYFRTYHHCSSVCIGLAVGYFLVNRPQKQHVPWKISAPLWLASLVGCLSLILGSYKWNQGHLPSIGVAILYAGGSKVVWSLAMAWITIACLTGNGGIVNKFLSLPIFVPLGRLCYMVFLIHSVIHYMYIGSSRVPVRLDPITIGYMYFGTVTISFICAFILTLFFEAPFVALGKLIFAENLREKSELSKTLEREKSDGKSVENNAEALKNRKSDKKVD